MDFVALAWIVAIVGLAVGLVGFLRWLLEPAFRNRLLRCPEAGCVAFVEAGRVFRSGGTIPELAVYSCELWPERKNCARGCLARYDEAAPGYRIKLEALRPFEH
jgi:hypothetical protein